MKKSEIVINTEYLDKLFYTESFTKAVIAMSERILKFRKRHPFDAIAFTGVSGAGMAFAVSYKTKIPLICIRKHGDKSHSHLSIEGCISAKKYIIVDDFISNGNTVRKIVCTIKKNIDAKPVGIFLYAGYGLDKKIDKIPIFKVKS